MKKFYLKAVMSGIPDNNIVKVDGFAKAEKKANEILSELIGKGYSNVDTCVCLSENERGVMYLDVDVYALKRDCYGDVSWYKSIYGVYCYICDRLLHDDEKEELEEWMNEKDIHIWDLSKDDLKKLRGEIILGSMFLSDYDNSFNINTEEVSDYAEDYEQFLEEDGLEDTPQQFADYISDKCA